MKDDEVDPFFMINQQATDIKKELDKMLANKEVTVDDYNKQITLLAYSYSLNGFPDDCILMLMNTLEDYFANKAIEHFKEDQEYFTKCTLIFEVLSYIGYVPFDVMATQKPATA